LGFPLQPVALSANSGPGSPDLGIAQGRALDYP